MSGLESCLCIASLIECRESRCLPCKIIVRIQLILAKSLCLVGSKCYINISLLIWMALGRAVTDGPRNPPDPGCRALLIDPEMLFPFPQALL